MRRATHESPLTQGLLIGTLILFVGTFLLFPVYVILREALRQGLAAYAATLGSSESGNAVRLTLLVALVVVPLNTLFGVAAAWSITHFSFRGKALLTSLIELPVWISPVIGGLSFALLFGRQGWLGGWLFAHDIRILFAFPGLVLGTAFVTFPFVARGLIPLMRAQGQAEEQAALTLGANGWQLFWRISFPKLRWGLFYGVVLCNARAMGEFGAVSVLAGQNFTMPLQIEQYYLGRGLPQAFTLASLLLGLALVTLALKTALEWRRPSADRPGH